jgi:hypothetical protein
MTQNDDFNQTLLDLNNYLDLYVPAGVNEAKDMEKYEQLFAGIRHLFYDQEAIDEATAKDFFIRYYNEDEIGKIGVLNEVENLSTKKAYEKELNTPEISQEDIDKIMEVYLTLDMPKRGQYLFFLENGKLPTDGEDYSSFIQKAEEFETELQTVLQSSAVEEETRSSTTALSAEEVTQKYLKGSGLLNPSDRNKGFTVGDLK